MVWSESWLLASSATVFVTGADSTTHPLGRWRLNRRRDPDRFVLASFETAFEALEAAHSAGSCCVAPELGRSLITDGREPSRLTLCGFDLTRTPKPVSEEPSAPMLSVKLLRMMGRVPPSPRSNSRRAILIWVGAFSPVAFTTTYLIEGATRPGYHAATRPISDLSTGPGGWVQVLNFVLLGLAMLALTSASGSTAVASTWTRRLLGLFGVGLIIAGLFVTDPLPG